MAEAEEQLEATHGDDESSVASTTSQGAANASETNNVAAFESLSSFQVNSIAARFTQWAQRAASSRREQLRLRQADAFARDRSRAAPTPAPKPPAKPPARAKSPRKPAQPLMHAAKHAAMDFLAADLQSKLSSLGLEEMAGGLAAASILNMGDVIAYTSGKQLRDEIERSGEFKVPLHNCNSLFAKKPPAPRPPPAADEADDMLEGLFSSMDAASKPSSSLPLVEALCSRVIPAVASALL